MQKHNILIAHYRSDIVSGAENSITDLVEKLDGRFNITMLVPGNGKLADFFRDRNISVWVKNIETPRRLFPGLHEVQSLIFAQELKKKKYHAVICNTFASAARISTSAKYASLPLACYMRDYIKKTAGHKKLLNKFQSIYSISNDVANYLNNMTCSNNIFLAYNYINPQPILNKICTHRESSIRLLPFESRVPVVGVVGRITPYKRLDIFIRAIPLVLQSMPDTRFVIIGSAQEREKDYEASLKQLAQSLGIENKVVFMGQRNDVIEITSELTISCLASEREPLGRVVLEAHLLKVPTIVPDTGGASEIVDDEVTGLKFSPTTPGSEVELARQIIRLLTNPILYNRLISAATEKITTTFASMRHVQIQEEYFDQLCS